MLRAPAAHRKQRTIPPLLGAVISWAGLAVLAYCGLALSGSTPFPGTAALLPVLATVAVIAVGMPDSRWSPRRLIELRFVQWTGDISYPLYLWHWPPIVVLPVVLGHDLTFWQRVAVLVGTFAAAALTKRLVEDPIRTGRRLGIQRSSVTFAFTAATACALAAACLSGIRHADAVADRAEQVSEKIASAAPDCFGAASMVPGPPCVNPELDGQLVPDTTAILRDNANFPGCESTNEVRDSCTFGDAADPGLPHVLVIGDSHARAMLPIFVDLAKSGKIFLTAQVKGGCAWSANPHPNPDRTIVESCAQWRASVASWLDTQADDLDLIVTAALAHPRPATGPQEQVAGFAKTWRTMTRRGVPVVAIRDNPYLAVSTNECLAQESEITADSCAFPRSEAFPNYDPLIKATEQVEGSTLLDLTDLYCHETVCPAVIGGVNVYRDRTHLSKTYVRTMTPFVAQRLRDAGVLAKRPR